MGLNKKGYNSVQSALSKGRKDGYIDWDKIEDRTRQPTTPPMWYDIDDFIDTIRIAYKKDIWIDQPIYFEVWLEKKALYGIINPVCRKYGVTLQTISGYSSISAIYDGAERFRRYGKENNFIIYLGDHDPSGLDIDRNLKDTFWKDHNLDIDVIRIGLLYEDIKKYNLPTNEIKKSDKRTAKYPYTIQAELDALNPNILIDRIESAIISHLDIVEYNHTIEIESQELNTIKSRFDGV